MESTVLEYSTDERWFYNVGLHGHVNWFIFYHGLFQLYAFLIPAIHNTWSWRSMKNQFPAARTADWTLVGSYSESIVTITFKVGNDFTCATHFYLIPRQHFLISINLPIFEDIAIGFILFWMVPVYPSIVIHFALLLIDLWHIYAWKKYERENSVKILFQNLYFSFYFSKNDLLKILKGFLCCSRTFYTYHTVHKKKNKSCKYNRMLDFEDMLSEISETEKNKCWLRDSTFARYLK